MARLMATESEIWQWLEQVPDPEIPVLSVVDLGIIRSVSTDGQKTIVTITPTYSGCPAMQTIAINIRAVLEEHQVPGVEILTVLSPAWTTDWLSESGRKKLEAYGIAPPVESSQNKRSLFSENAPVPCPRCHSTHTIMISQFGSTACKSLYQCKDCLEPFDYFKCH